MSPLTTLALTPSTPTVITSSAIRYSPTSYQAIITKPPFSTVLLTTTGEPLVTSNPPPFTLSSTNWSRDSLAPT